ncbi:unnamed protein product, partial [Aureobasidium pullulans]
MCVNVETESDSGNMTEAEIQLGIWVSAQYLKLKKLLTHNSKPLTLPWLPLTLTGMYTVISVLKLLFQWANTEYRSWFKDNAVMP